MTFLKKTTNWVRSWSTRKNGRCARRQLARAIEAMEGRICLNAIVDGGPDLFFATSAYPIPSGYEQFTAADLNDDNKADLVMTNTATGNLTVLLSGPTGYTSTDFFVGPAPTAPVIGDIDGDGDLDISVLDNSNDELYTWVNDNNTGAFSMGPILGVGASPTCQAIVDVNGDNLNDIVVGTSSGIETYLNVSGDFGSAIVSEASSARDMAVADINGDGHYDLVLGGIEGLLHAWLGDGTGAFTSGGQSYSIFDSVGSVAAADFNGDVYPEVIGASGMNFYFVHNVAGVLQGGADLSTYNYSNRVVAADMNADGRGDIISTQGGGLVMRLGWGDNTFAQASFSSPFATDLTVGDFNGDSLLDAAALDSSGSIQFYYQKPYGPIAMAGASLSGVPSTLTNAIVGTFVDPYAAAAEAQYTVSVDWGDGGGFEPATVQQVATNVYNVIGSHSYAAAGFYTTHLRLTHTTQRIASAIGAVDANTYQTTVAVIDDVAWQGLPFTTPVATFTSSYPSATAGDFSAQIDWGDGTIDAGVVSFAGGAGYVSGAHTYTSTGVKDVSVVLTGPGGGASDTGTITVYSSDLNVMAVNTGGFAGQPLPSTVVAAIYDPLTSSTAGDFTATIDWGDGSAQEPGTVQGSNGSYYVTGSHTYSSAGTYPISVSVTHSDTRTASGSGVASIIDSMIVSPALYNTTEGTPISNGLMATFFDTAGGTDPAAYSASIDWGDGSASTAGTIVNSGTGAFNVLGSHTYTTADYYSVHVVVTHTASGRTAATDSGVQIFPSTFWTSGIPVTGTNGQSLDGVAVAYFSDPYPGTVAGEYAASIDWGDGTSTTTGTIALISTQTWRVDGTHTYALPGVYPIQVSLTHVPTSRSTVITSSAAISAGDLVLGVPAVAASAGVPFIDQVIAAISDPVTTSAPGDFTAVIDWGDGTPTAAGVVQGADGTYYILGSHTYAAGGSYPLSVTVTHADTRTISNQGTAVVIDVPLPLELTGTVIDGLANRLLDHVVVAQISGDAGHSYTAMIDWGDGTSPTAGSVQTATSPLDQFTWVSGSHTYVTPGIYTITVNVQDTTSEQSASTTSTANIALANLSAGAVKAVRLSSGDYRVGVQVNDALLTTTAGDFTASIDWGDGHTTDAVVSPGPGGGAFIISGTHAYASSGSYPIHISVEHKDGRSVQPAGAILVPAEATMAAHNLLAIEGVSTALVRVASLDGQGSHKAGDYRAVIYWGDGRFSSGKLVSDGAGAFAVRGRHVYTKLGDYTTRVVVRRSDGKVFRGSATARVADAAHIGMPLRVVARMGAVAGPVYAFTDINAYALARDYSATIEWGDGTITSGVIRRRPNGVFQVLGEHRYATGGRYAIRVHVTETEGSPGAEEVGRSLVVVR